ncbi:MAG: HAMP domain-containing histidine kinase [Lachnospiraceae bacterium]|nr:HAMP domain-containing histidine kinase [Lachnospiraceae bacterium]
MNYDQKGLHRKNQIYSIILAVILLGFLVGYFIYMLPSLYVSYHMEQNLKSVEVQHRTYVETGSYDGIRLKNPTACLSVRLPLEGDSIFLTSQSWKTEVTVKENYTKTILLELQQFLNKYHNGAFSTDQEKEQVSKEIEVMINHWKELIQTDVNNGSSLPVNLNIQFTGNIEYHTNYTKVHMVSDELMIFEAVVEDDVNTYINYLAVENTESGMVFTVLPAMMPDMNEIRPVVFQSIPMLSTVILLIVLLFSQLYSKEILNPVYHELEEKNHALQKENERQEIFLRASSHQLKTPLSAALLLLDGMINQVGKYKDTSTYLPKTKEQLLSMRKVVEDILSLNHSRDHIKLQKIQIMPLVESKLQAYKVVMSDKQLKVSCIDADNTIIVTDECLFLQIMDNLISNAVKYTPFGEKIEIRISKTGILMENYGVTIPEDILPHIFDPFVSGNHEPNISSHGLGLYIASYYAKQIDLSIHMKNCVESVMTTVNFL